MLPLLVPQLRHVGVHPGGLTPGGEPRADAEQRQERRDAGALGHQAALEHRADGHAPHRQLQRDGAAAGVADPAEEETA